MSYARANPQASASSADQYLETLDHSLRDGQQILISIRRTYLDSNYKTGLRFKNIFKVRNSALSARYEAKKAALAGISLHVSNEVLAFACYRNKASVEKILKHGLSVRHGQFNFLGNSAYGVNLCLHADVQLKSAEANTSTSAPNIQDCWLLVFKILPGRIRQIPADKSVQTPSNGFDCHVSTVKPTFRDDLSQQAKHSQIYLYEWIGEALNPTPSQILPYAVLSFSKLASSSQSQASTSTSYTQASAHARQPTPPQVVSPQVATPRSVPETLNYLAHNLALQQQQQMGAAPTIASSSRFQPPPNPFLPVANFLPMNMNPASSQGNPMLTSGAMNTAQAIQGIAAQQALLANQSARTVDIQPPPAHLGRASTRAQPATSGTGTPDQIGSGTGMMLPTVVVPGTTGRRTQAKTSARQSNQRTSRPSSATGVRQNTTEARIPQRDRTAIGALANITADALSNSTNHAHSGGVICIQPEGTAPHEKPGFLSHWPYIKQEPADAPERPEAQFRDWIRDENGVIIIEPDDSPGPPPMSSTQSVEQQADIGSPLNLSASATVSQPTSIETTTQRREPEAALISDSSDAVPLPSVGIPVTSVSVTSVPVTSVSVTSVSTVSVSSSISTTVTSTESSPVVTRASLNSFRDVLSHLHDRLHRSETNASGTTPSVSVRDSDPVAMGSGTEASSPGVVMPVQTTESITETPTNQVSNSICDERPVSRDNTIVGLLADTHIQERRVSTDTTVDDVPSDSAVENQVRTPDTVVLVPAIAQVEASNELSNQNAAGDIRDSSLTEQTVVPSVLTVTNTNMNSGDNNTNLATTESVLNQNPIASPSPRISDSPSLTLQNDSEQNDPVTAVSMDTNKEHPQTEPSTEHVSKSSNTPSVQLAPVVSESSRIIEDPSPNETSAVSTSGAVTSVTPATSETLIKTNLNVSLNTLQQFTLPSSKHENVLSTSNETDKQIKQSPKTSTEKENVVDNVNSSVQNTELNKKRHVEVNSDVGIAISSVTGNYNPDDVTGVTSNEGTPSCSAAKNVNLIEDKKSPITESSHVKPGAIGKLNKLSPHSKGKPKRKAATKKPSQKDKAPNLTKILERHKVLVLEDGTIELVIETVYRKVKLKPSKQVKTTEVFEGAADKSTRPVQKPTQLVKPIQTTVLGTITAIAKLSKDKQIAVEQDIPQGERGIETQHTPRIQEAKSQSEPKTQETKQQPAKNDSKPLSDVVAQAWSRLDQVKKAAASEQDKKKRFFARKSTSKPAPALVKAKEQKYKPGPKCKKFSKLASGTSGISFGVLRGDMSIGSLSEGQQNQVETETNDAKSDNEVPVAKRTTQMCDFKLVIKDIGFKVKDGMYATSSSEAIDKEVVKRATKPLSYDSDEENDANENNDLENEKIVASFREDYVLVERQLRNRFVAKPANLTGQKKGVGRGDSSRPLRGRKTAVRGRGGKRSNLTPALISESDTEDEMEDEVQKSENEAAKEENVDKTELPGKHNLPDIDKQNLTEATNKQKKLEDTALRRSTESEEGEIKDQSEMMELATDDSNESQKISVTTEEQKRKSLESLSSFISSIRKEQEEKETEGRKSGTDEPSGEALLVLKKSVSRESRVSRDSRENDSKHSRYSRSHSNHTRSSRSRSPDRVPSRRKSRSRSRERRHSKHSRSPVKHSRSPSPRRGYGRYNKRRRYSRSPSPRRRHPSSRSPRRKYTSRSPSPRQRSKYRSRSRSPRHRHKYRSRSPSPKSRQKYRSKSRSPSPKQRPKYRSKSPALPPETEGKNDVTPDGAAENVANIPIPPSEIPVPTSEYKAGKEYNDKSLQILKRLREKGNTAVDDLFDIVFGKKKTVSASPKKLDLFEMMYGKKKPEEPVQPKKLSLAQYKDRFKPVTSSSSAPNLSTSTATSTSPSASAQTVSTSKTSLVDYESDDDTDDETNIEKIEDRFKALQNAIKSMDKGEGSVELLVEVSRIGDELARLKAKKSGVPVSSVGIPSSALPPVEAHPIVTTAKIVSTTTTTSSTTAAITHKRHQRPSELLCSSAPNPPWMLGSLEPPGEQPALFNAYGDKSAQGASAKSQFDSDRWLDNLRSLNTLKGVSPPKHPPIPVSAPPPPPPPPTAPPPPPPPTRAPVPNSSSLMYSKPGNFQPPFGKGSPRIQAASAPSEIPMPHSGDRPSYNRTQSEPIHQHPAEQELPTFFSGMQKQPWTSLKKPEIPSHISSRDPRLKRKESCDVDLKSPPYPDAKLGAGDIGASPHGGVSPRASGLSPRAGPNKATPPGSSPLSNVPKQPPPPPALSQPPPPDRSFGLYPQLFPPPPPLNLIRIDVPEIDFENVKGFPADPRLLPRDNVRWNAVYTQYARNIPWESAEERAETERLQLVRAQKTREEVELLEAEEKRKSDFSAEPVGRLGFYKSVDQFSDDEKEELKKPTDGSDMIIQISANIAESERTIFFNPKRNTTIEASVTNPPQKEMESPKTRMSTDSDDGVVKHRHRTISNELKDYDVSPPQAKPDLHPVVRASELTKYKPRTSRSSSLHSEDGHPSINESEGKNLKPPQKRLSSDSSSFPSIKSRDPRLSDKTEGISRPKDRRKLSPATSEKQKSASEKSLPNSNRNVSPHAVKSRHVERTLSTERDGDGIQKAKPRPQEKVSDSANKDFKTDRRPSKDAPLSNDSPRSTGSSATQKTPAVSRSLSGDRTKGAANSARKTPPVTPISKKPSQSFADALSAPETSVRSDKSPKLQKSASSSNQKSTPKFATSDAKGKRDMKKISPKTIASTHHVDLIKPLPVAAIDAIEQRKMGKKVGIVNPIPPQLTENLISLKSALREATTNTVEISSDDQEIQQQSDQRNTGVRRSPRKATKASTNASRPSGQRDILPAKLPPHLGRIPKKSATVSKPDDSRSNEVNNSAAGSDSSEVPVVPKSQHGASKSPRIEVTLNSPKWRPVIGQVTGSDPTTEQNGTDDQNITESPEEQDEAQFTKDVDMRQQPDNVDLRVFPNIPEFGTDSHAVSQENGANEWTELPHLDELDNAAFPASLPWNDGPQRSNISAGKVGEADKDVLKLIDAVEALPQAEREDLEREMSKKLSVTITQVTNEQKYHNPTENVTSELRSKLVMEEGGIKENVLEELKVEERLDNLKSQISALKSHVEELAVGTKQPNCPQNVLDTYKMVEGQVYLLELAREYEMKKLEKLGRYQKITDLGAIPKEFLLDNEKYISKEGSLFFLVKQLSILDLRHLCAYKREIESAKLELRFAAGQSEVIHSRLILGWLHLKRNNRLNNLCVNSAEAKNKVLTDMQTQLGWYRIVQNELEGKGVEGIKQEMLNYTLDRICVMQERIGVLLSVTRKEESGPWYYKISSQSTSNQPNVISPQAIFNSLTNSPVVEGFAAQDIDDRIQPQHNSSKKTDNNEQSNTEESKSVISESNDIDNRHKRKRTRSHSRSSSRSSRSRHGSDYRTRPMNHSRSSSRRGSRSPYRRRSRSPSPRRKTFKKSWSPRDRSLNRDRYRGDKVSPARNSNSPGRWSRSPRRDRSRSFSPRRSRSRTPERRSRRDNRQWRDDRRDFRGWGGCNYGEYSRSPDRFIRNREPRSRSRDRDFGIRRSTTPEPYPRRSRSPDRLNRRPLSQERFDNRPDFYQEQRRFSRSPDDRYVRRPKSPDRFRRTSPPRRGDFPSDCYVNPDSQRPYRSPRRSLSPPRRLSPPKQRYVSPEPSPTRTTDNSWVRGRGGRGGRGRGNTWNSWNKWQDPSTYRSNHGKQNYGNSDFRPNYIKKDYNTKYQSNQRGRGGFY